MDLRICTTLLEIYDFLYTFGAYRNCYRTVIKYYFQRFSRYYNRPPDRWTLENLLHDDWFYNWKSGNITVYFIPFIKDKHTCWQWNKSRYLRENVIDWLGGNNTLSHRWPACQMEFGCIQYFQRNIELYPESYNLSFQIYYGSGHCYLPWCNICHICINRHACKCTYVKKTHEPHGQ